MPPRIDDQTRAAILADLQAENGSTRDIAERHGVGHASVSRIAKDAGLALDRSKTVHATRARLADIRELRARLAERTLRRAHKVLDRLDADTYSSKQVAPNGAVVTVETEHPPARDERDLAAAVSSYTTAAERVTDNDSGADATKSLLGSLDKALSAMYEQNCRTPEE
ncbi:hypothetical protein [Glycomyces arizonensis]|uniref:hypothetical protein n=1 Tax=Glycomyces arizonensis TaxID=256035 RepID=UPI000405640A|nr:hypothetical protein [Glycomyces arizonensis]